MQGQEGSLLVIPNNFPAKLWHVVNNPDVAAIVWESQGEVIIIDKDIIEKQVLSPNDMTINRCQAFGAMTFLSFIRKLYAYGFKKARYPPTIQPNIYQFFHPNFKKDKPELLSLVSRNLPKYRRVHQSDLKPNIPPEEKRIEKKDVCIQCEDGNEDFPEENNSHQEPVEPIPMVTSEAETTVQPQLHRSHKAAGPSIVYNRPPVSRSNYYTSLVPYPTHRRYPYLNTGVSNVVYRPGQFVPTICWYQQDPVAPGFCGFYQMGYPGNTVRVPSMYPVEPASPFAQRMPCPSTSILKSCVVTPMNHPSPVSQHLSFISIDSDTSTTSLQNSPVTEAKMQGQENAILVIPNNFPAKLWHVVNNPEVPAIVWDSRGEVIIIHRDLIEKQVLSPTNMTLNSCHTFKPITFVSFIRQLYAYGFKKAPYPPTVQPNICQFFHPNFKKSNPELLKLLSRNLPKCQRIPQADPTTTALAEKKRNERKEDGEENVHEGILHQPPVEPVPVVTPDPETAVRLPFHKGNTEADRYKVYSRPKMPQGNFNKSLVPYPTPRRYPCLNSGVSQVVSRPGQFVPTFCWYQQDPTASYFCSFYRMGYPGNTVPVPPMYPMEPALPLAQRMLCSSTSIPKSVVTPLNHPSTASQHPSHISSDGKTSTQSSPVPKAAANVQDTSREQ